MPPTDDERDPAALRVLALISTHADGITIDAR